MKFLINATNLKSGGALQVARSLLQTWHRSADNHEFCFVVGPSLSQLQRNTQRLQVYVYPEHPRYVYPGSKRFQEYMHQLEKQLKPDAALTIFGPSLWRPDCPHLCGFANGIYLFNQDEYIRHSYPRWSLSGLRYRLYRRILLHTLAKNADAFWVETSIARDQLLRRKEFRSKEVFVVGNTYPEDLQTPGRKAISAVPRFLFLSAYYPHKNFNILPDIIHILSAKKIRMCFVLSLPEAAFAPLQAAAADRSYLENKGPVPMDSLQAVYNDCDFVFIPSLLETFSSNFPEAMHCNKPIVCADRPYARLLCADAALYFDPLSATDAAEKIERLLQDETLQEQLRLKGNTRLRTMETPESRAEKILHHLIHLSQATTI